MSEESEDLEMLAAEYVLGSMAGAERTAFEQRMRTDAAARAAVGRWADRLSPLASAIPGRAPPESLWRRIEAEIGAGRTSAKQAAGRPAAQSRARRPMLVWGTLGAFAAAILVAVLVIPRESLVRPPTSLLVQATFDGEAGAPRYRVLVAGDGDQIYVEPTGAPPPPTGRVHELWVLEPDGTPVSLGLLNPQRASNLDVPDAAQRFLARGATVAISLEPAGGSPLDRPSGPVLIATSLVAPA